MLAAILMAGVVMTAGLSIDKFRRTHTDLLDSRFQFVVNDIRHRIETQMDLGLALATLEDVSEELETYRVNDETILSIEVFDENGSVLFSTDPSFIGDLVSQDWLLAWRSSQNKNLWSILERDAGVVGVAIQNNLNQKVGSLALRYSREFLDLSVANQTERLLVIGLIIAAVMALVSFLGCRILLRGPISDLNTMTRAMTDIMNNEKDSPNIKLANENHAEFASFSETALQAHVALNEASEEIIQLDEEDK